MADVADTDVLTLAEGLTLTASELAAYGATLTDTGYIVPPGDPGTDTGTLDDTGEVYTVNPGGTDTGTLAEGVTLTVSELSAYGATLTDTGETQTVTPEGTDTLTLAEGVTLTVAELSAYGATLTETGIVGAFDGTDSFSVADVGVLTESGVPSDAASLIDDFSDHIIDDLVADATLTESITVPAAVTGTDTGTLTDTGVVATNIAVYATSDDDTITLDDALPAVPEDEVAYVVVAVVDPDTGTLVEVAAITVVQADTGMLTEAGVGAAVTVGSDTGTLTESGQVTISGGAVVVVLTATDSATLTDTGVLAGTLFGKPLGTIALEARLPGSVQVRRRVATTDTELEPLAVGAGDL